VMVVVVVVIVVVVAAAVMAKGEHCLSGWTIYSIKGKQNTLGECKKLMQFTLEIRSRGSSVNIVTRVRGSIHGRGTSWDFFSSPPLCPDQPRVPPSFLFSGYWGLFPRR
jgi:hypothetical protein